MLWKTVRIQTPLRVASFQFEKFPLTEMFGCWPGWQAADGCLVQVTISTRLILHSHVLLRELQAALELQQNFCEIQVVSATVFQEEFLLEF